MSTNATATAGAATAEHDDLLANSVGPDESGGVPTTASTVLATAPATTPASLLCLSDAVLDLALGYLDSDSLVACQATCRAVGSAAQSAGVRPDLSIPAFGDICARLVPKNICCAFTFEVFLSSDDEVFVLHSNSTCPTCLLTDDLWRSKCLEDWGEERRVRPEQRSELVSTFLESWRAWRRAFNSYHPRLNFLPPADVVRIGTGCGAEFSPFLCRIPRVSLNVRVGVSEEELDTAEEALGWPLPTHLRLLYRFHNGQASNSSRGGCPYLASLLRETYRLGALHDSELVVCQLSCRSVVAACLRAFPAYSAKVEENLLSPPSTPLPAVCKVQGTISTCMYLQHQHVSHKQQWLPWDEKLIIPVGVDEGRPAVLPKVVGSGMSLGLLGGYCFYQRMTTSKLFSLQRGVVGGLVTDASFDGDNRGYFEACANRWGTDLDTIRARGGFLLAAGPQMMKRYRMCGIGEERLPRIVWEAKWANKKRGRQPTEWVRVVEDVWKGLDIDEDETLETEGTKLRVRFRTGDIGLRERRRRHRTVDDEDDEFKCDCGFECEDRVHVVAECPLYKKEREVYVTELGKIDGTYREMFEAWNREERTVAVLGHRRWVEKAGRDIVRIDRLGKTFLSHLWQSRKERLAIGDRSCGNNAPSSRGRVTWVGNDGNVRFDGKSGSLMGVFDAAPVLPPSPNPDGAPGSGAGDVKRRHRGGNLMTWLEEYLRRVVRLQCGHYMVRSKWRESIQRAGEAVPRSHLLRGVWLFPAEGGDGCVTDVTQAMSSCQLSTRHWEIDGPDGFHREVSGDGVIGVHPTLRVPAPPAGDVRGGDNGGVFEYQSITTLERTPGTMGGHFSFTPGDLNSPRGAQFNARVPTFHLEEPTFLY
ncbi:unnamed protein product [Ectocarpus sp. CCAP 1310/34]|nr:unnamed protein product [Ectocarpus sp. CCAP 1310/34]